MELILKAAFERDVDLVLARAFYEKNRTAQLFLKNEDKILQVQHSAMELHGESDLQIIVERNALYASRTKWTHPPSQISIRDTVNAETEERSKNDGMTILFLLQRPKNIWKVTGKQKNIRTKYLTKKFGIHWKPTHFPLP